MRTDPQDRKQERLQRIGKALRENDSAALICSRNADVLLLSGYLPVKGPAIAIATAEPRVELLVPADEQQRAGAGWADRVHPVRTGGLEIVPSASAPLIAPLHRALAALLPALGLQSARLHCETGSGLAVSSYVAQSVLGGALTELVQAVLPHATLQPAAELLAGLRMLPTAWERERIRLACTLAGQAYEECLRTLHPGTPETEAVLPFHAAYIARATAHHDVGIAGANFYCMAGPDGFDAAAAFQQSRRHRLQPGEPVLVHCNAHVDGYWTDLTRTCVLGAADARLAALMSTLVQARDAALAMIRPGMPAFAVDRAARTVLEQSGYGAAFRHATGHGVGFYPIEHAERPRLHPVSPDILEEGMVCNVEPAIYLEGFGGLRDCNMVEVTATGHTLLSPFHLQPSDWVIAEDDKAGQARDNGAPDWGGLMN